MGRRDDRDLASYVSGALGRSLCALSRLGVCSSSLVGPWLEDRPHPWLLIEDAHVNTLEVLKTLHPHLVAGDCVIVEDTGFLLEKYRALERFMAQYGQHYRVDTRYTDLFGYNATLSFNGYLKRV
jgi:cephalosporin hydroxylase